MALIDNWTVEFHGKIKRLRQVALSLSLFYSLGFELLQFHEILQMYFDVAAWSDHRWRYISATLTNKIHCSEKKNTDKNAGFGLQNPWIMGHWSPDNAPNRPSDDPCWLSSMMSGNLTGFTSDFTDLKPIFGGHKKNTTCCFDLLVNIKIATQCKAAIPTTNIFAV